MALFDGLAGTDYQDILRAIGQEVDRRELRHLRILEVEAGLLVQGLPPPTALGALPAMATIVWTHADLQSILRAAYRRRARDAASPAPSPAAPDIRPASASLLARDRRHRTPPTVT